MFRRGPALLALAALLALTGAPSADVIVMKNGQTSEGVLEDRPDDPATFFFTTTAGTLTVPRAQVAEIRRESPAVSWGKLGDAFLAKDKAEEAIRSYEKALGFDPANADLKGRLAAAQAEMNKQASASRESLRREAITLLEDARRLAEAKKFNDALDKVRSAESRGGVLVAEEVRKTMGDLNYLWGLSMIDRLDPKGAAEKLEAALQYTPENASYRDVLIETYEKLPDKRDVVLEHYRAKLDSEPGNAQLTLKVARMEYDKGNYTEAANMLLGLADRNMLEGRPAQEMLERSLSQVVTAATNARDFQTARDYYERMLKYFPGHEESYLHYFEYYLMVNSLDQNNPYEHLKAGQYALGKGLNDVGKVSFSKALQLKPDLEEASQGLQTIARADLNEARGLLSAGDLDSALAKAQKIQQEFPRSPEVQEEAQILIERVRNQILEAERQNQRDAKEIARRGDEYYDRARGFVAELTSTQFDRNVRTHSPRTEAIRFYQRAIAAYDAALAKDRTLAELQNGDYATKLADAQRELASLSGPAIPFSPTIREFDRSREEGNRRSGTTSGTTNPNSTP